MLEEAHDSEELIERVAALDTGKAELVCCARVLRPDRPGRRLQEVASYQTMTRSLLVLAERLSALGVTQVVEEATSGARRNSPPRRRPPRPGGRGGRRLPCQVEMTFMTGG